MKWNDFEADQKKKEKTDEVNTDKHILYLSG